MVWYTKRRNKLYSEVWKQFSQGYPDVPALLACAMLTRQVRATFKIQLTEPTEQLTLSLSTGLS